MCSIDLNKYEKKYAKRNKPSPNKFIGTEEQLLLMHTHLCINVAQTVVSPLGKCIVITYSFLSHLDQLSYWPLASLGIGDFGV